MALRNNRVASPIYVDSYEPAVALMRSGKADAFASIREVLLEYAPNLPESRVLEDNYLTNLAGVAVAKGNLGRLAFVNETLDQ